MNADKLFNLLGSIVTVAIITTVVTNRNSAEVIKAFGAAFAGSIRAAQGK